MRCDACFVVGATAAVQPAVAFGRLEGRRHPLVGIALGLPSGYGLGRLVESQLYGLTARDPVTFAVATAVLVVSAALAGYVPAARATRVDPLVALRYE